MKKVGLLVTLFLVAGISFGCAGTQKSIELQPGPMPAGGDFDGIYQSDFGRLELTANGNQVQGLFEDDQHFGRLQGRVEGSLLHFSWSQWTEDMQGRARESRGHGMFKYIVEKVDGAYQSSDTHRLEGAWGYDDGPLVNTWNAYRLSSRAKRILKPHDITPDKEMPGAEEYDDGQGFSDRQPEEEPTEPDATSEVEF